MSNFNDKLQGMLEGLSDFWLLYFKEIDQLRALYKGADIQVGQSYLDMLALLMNNSIRDAPLFNKEYFRSLQLMETDLQFQQRSTPEQNRYLYTATDGLVTARALHNKLFSVTAALELGLDYDVDIDNRVFEFTYDPLNAYLHHTFGEGNSEFTLRTRDPLVKMLSVQLLDTGTLSVDITTNITGDTITIAYDGPASTNTITARDIVAAINTHILFSGQLVAELTQDGGGNASPAGTLIIPLTHVGVSPLDGYASRLVNISFGGKVTTTGIADWVSSGVEKGDIIRFISGSTIATPQEVLVSLVRSNALYTTPGSAITSIKASDKLEFSILREPEDHTSSDEPLPDSAVSVASGADGVITAATRQFVSASASFSFVHKGDLIQLQGTLNVGYARINTVINSTTVILDATNLVNEALVIWDLLTTISPVVILANGVLTNNGDGTANFSSVSAPFISTVAAVGTVIRIYRAGALERYEVINKVSTTEVVVIAATSVANGAALTWGWSRYRFPSTSVAYPFIKEGSVIVNARRLVDEQIVEEGRDYVIDEDLAIINPITVWRADVDITITYDYRLLVVANTAILQSGADGTLTYGTTSTFSSPTANFTYADIGQALYITNSVASPTNNGTYIIAAITSATVAQLTSDRLVNSIVEGNNGALGWELRRRAVWATDNITTLVHELSFWAPDALVDRFNLYNTYGYLLNRYEKSSENYRSLILGIFQLFMLGPTLERFESAVNIVAGLSVIRDNGEILLEYDDEAVQTGIDGFLSSTTNQFSAASAVFTASMVGNYIYISDGLNENKLFMISEFISTTIVLLMETPTTEGPISWELTATGTHNVATSKNIYSYARTIPLRDEVIDPANFGVTIFSSFTVLTDVFNVTDYVETPTWWERAQIPEELWEGEDGLRRQSTPALFENRINPADDGRIGDPGYIVGADSLGFSPPSVTIYTDGALSDGNLVGDPNYPFTNDVYFNTSTNLLFSSSDIGNVLVITGVGSFRITQVLSTSNVKLEVFTKITSATGLEWRVDSQPLALRHKAAFVILDTWLKYHTFSLSFNPALLGNLSAELITDLQSLVLISKPAYTYILVSPSSLLLETILVEENTLELDMSMYLGGDEGEIISGNASPLLVVGSSWKIGTWFRYKETASSFTAPAASVNDVLGIPTVGYIHYISKFTLNDPTDFTTASRPIPHSGFVERIVASGVGATLALVSGSWVITLPSMSLQDFHIGAAIRITGSGNANNNRDHFIGKITSSTQATVGDYTGGSADTGLTWQLITHGGYVGYVRNTDTGATLFSDAGSVHTFNIVDAGTYVRYAFTSNVENQVFEIGYVASNGNPECELFSTSRVYPIETDPDATGAVSGIIFTAATAIFSSYMCRVDQEFTDYSTSQKNRYFVVFTSGANSGVRRRLKAYTSGTQVTVDGADLTADAAVDYYLEVERCPTVVTETSTWEHLQNFIVIDGNEIDLSNTPTQDASTPVLYTAYGVREPIDPSVEVFDDTLGDSYYFIGMPDPRPKQGRSRSGNDTDLREDPIQITRI